MVTVRALGGGVALAAATVACWYLWLGRDTDYQTDAAGDTTGPYTTGQVAGCVLTLLALAVFAVLLRVPVWIVIVAMTVSFTAAWTAQAAGTDETGMYGVGAILVFLGMAVGTTLFALVTRLLMDQRAAR
jgi:hypothetical protein